MTDAKLIEHLQHKVAGYAKLLDAYMGTPCEQVRHEQEIERLRVENERLRTGIKYIGLTMATDGADNIAEFCEELLSQQTPRYVCETCRDNPYLCSTIPTSHCAKAEALKDE
jgi:hypothetical protein